MQRSYSEAIAHNNGFSSENGPARSGGAEYTALRTATSTRARFGAVPLGLHGNEYIFGCHPMHPRYRSCTMVRSVEAVGVSVALELAAQWPETIAPFSGEPRFPAIRGVAFEYGRIVRFTGWEAAFHPTNPVQTNPHP